MEDLNRKGTARRPEAVTGIVKPSSPLEAPKFSAGELGQIQEILFGDQLRAHAQQILRLSQTLESRLDSLSASCKQQFEQLHTKIDTCTSDLQANSDSASRLQQQLDSRVEQTRTDMSASLDGTRTELKDMLEAAIAQMQTQKIDRDSLSQLLNNVASQLATDERQAGGSEADGYKTPSDSSVDRS